MKHDHSCGCGTTKVFPHNIGENGCQRFMTSAPQPIIQTVEDFRRDGKMWKVREEILTDYSLRHQRGYFQHPCGCWSRWRDSSNSIEMD